MKREKWFNHHYIQAMDNKEAAALFMPILESHGVKADPAYVEKVVAMMKDRATFIKDLWDLARSSSSLRRNMMKRHAKNAGRKTVPPSLPN